MQEARERGEYKLTEGSYSDHLSSFTAHLLDRICVTLVTYVVALFSLLHPTRRYVAHVHPYMFVLTVLRGVAVGNLVLLQFQNFPRIGYPTILQNKPRYLPITPWSALMRPITQGRLPLPLPTYQAQTVRPLIGA